MLVSGTIGLEGAFNDSKAARKGSQWDVLGVLLCRIDSLHCAGPAQLVCLHQEMKEDGRLDNAG